MGKIDAAVTDTGPLIHLLELQQQKLLAQLIDALFTTPEVIQELLPVQQQSVKAYLKIKDLDGQSKDLSRFLTEEFELHLGEATAIALGKSEKIKLFLTDDLAARTVAKRFGLEPHGTIGLLLRAFREGLLSQSETIALLHRLHQTSLYLTSDLVQWAAREVEKYTQERR